MLGTLSSSLKGMKKSKLFRDAYLYDVIKKTLQVYTAENLDSQLLDPKILDAAVVLKESSKKLEITVKNNNSTFLAWLKMNLSMIEERVKSELKSKSLITNSTLIVIKVRSK